MCLHETQGHTPTVLIDGPFLVLLTFSLLRPEAPSTPPRSGASALAEPSCIVLSSDASDWLRRGPGPSGTKWGGVGEGSPALPSAGGTEGCLGTDSPKLTWPAF